MDESAIAFLVDADPFDAMRHGYRYELISVLIGHSNIHGLTQTVGAWHWLSGFYGVMRTAIPATNKHRLTKGNPYLIKRAPKVLIKD